MANKSIIDVDTTESITQEDLFYVNSNKSLKQIKNKNLKFDYDTHVINKPSINGIELCGGGGKSLNELGIGSSADIEDLRQTKAGAIINSARGERIAVGDSAGAFFNSLKFYGKSEQNGTPTPDNPILIKSCGDVGEIGIEVFGKNLLQKNKIKRSQDNVYLFNDGKGFHMENGASYSLSLQTVVNAIYLIPIGKNSSDAIKKVTGDNKLTFTATEDINVYFNIYIPGAAESVTNIQLEYAKNPTDYEEPKEVRSTSLSTPNGLPGLPVESGGNYTDSNGQQWVCDEMDFGRGKHVQRVKKAVFNGSEDWNLESISQKGFANFYVRNLSGIRTYSNVLSNQFKNQTTVISETTEEGIANLSTLYVRVDKTKADNANKFKEFLKTNNLEICYQLSAPIETDIPEETMTAYRKLYTNYPTTVIQNDSGAGMEVEYVADTKSYIDNKLKELIQAAYGNMANMLSLMPTNVQAEMIENDTNNILNNL